MTSRDEALRLFEDNIALARFAGRRYGGLLRNSRETAPEDVSQICLAALWSAALRFDGNRGCHFSTFAVSTMRGEMKKALRAELKQAGLRAVSAYAWEGLGAFDVPDPCDVAAEAAARADLEAALARMPERTRGVVACHAAGMRQQEIGRALGISQAHVSRVLKEAKQRVD